jgi:hypothetical protein
MALFRRKPAEGDADVGVLLLQGHDMIEQTAEAHRQRWGFGSADRWELDQVEGLLRFTFSDRVAEAPVQILGTYSPAGGSWMWAWANDSLTDALCVASEKVRAWGEQQGQAMLTTARMQVGEEQAAALAALAFRVSGLSGFYRAPAGRSHLYLGFGTVTLIDAAGKREDFSINLG